MAPVQDTAGAETLLLLFRSLSLAPLPPVAIGAAALYLVALAGDGETMR